MNLPSENTASRNLVIVCVEDHPKVIAMMHMARRRALEIDGVWRAVFVETPHQLQMMENGPHERMLRWLTLAQQMGGETAYLEAVTMEKGLALLLEKEAPNIRQVIMGNAPTESKLSFIRIWQRKRLVRRLRESVPVEMISVSGHHYRRGWIERLHLRNFRPMNLLYAFIPVAVAYFCAWSLKELLPPALFRINDQNVGLIFMIACAFAAGRFGLLPGLVASVASFLTVNYYYTVPYEQIKINTVTDTINMALFLSAALLISLFTSQTRGYAQRAAKRETGTQALFTLYRVASEAFSRPQALEKLQSKLEHMLEMQVAFFLPHPQNPKQIELAYPSELILQENDQKALEACWSETKTTGAASPFNPGTAWRFEPMISVSREVGVLGVRPKKRIQLDAWFGRLLSAIADQTATILEHIDMERSMEENRVREEREQLRTMLLSSVTHDFKTPLAGIIGALSVHKSLGDRLDPHKQAELLDAAMEEAQRLDSFITNILDMTRLETGNIRFRKEWHDLKSMINSVTKRMHHRLRGHEIIIGHYPGDIEVNMDVMMTEQVLQNLLDNAGKYTAAGTKIEIYCDVESQEGVICHVRDHGSGLPPEKIGHVFDKYARLHKKDSQVAGTGLGLAISKAVMEAQGGWIRAGNHPEGGAVFSFCLPTWRKVESLKQGAGL